MHAKTWSKLFCLLTTFVFAHFQGFGQTPVTFTSAKFQGRKLTFLLYKPERYDPGARIPLLVYLHGSGSVGTDIQKVREQGIPKLIDEGKKIPYLVAVPQLPPDMNNRWDPAFVNEFFKHIFFYYNVDRSRVYLTGHSMGGTGVWDYTTAYPENIACAVPLSGWGDKESVCKMKDVPTWVFHGAKDVTVNPAGSRNLASMLKSCGGKVTLTELPNGDHDIWRQVYTDPALMVWINMNTKRVLAPKDVKLTAQKNKKNESSNETITIKLPAALKNVTGIVAGDSGRLFGVSDNATPFVTSFDTTGRVHSLIKVTGVSNLSWSDIATNGDDVYIADTGNETYKRKFFQVYKIRRGELSTSKSVAASMLEFVLPDGLSLDLRSLFVADGKIYLFGAEPAKSTVLISIDDRSGAQQTALIVARCKNMGQFFITSSYYNSVTRKLTVLDNTKIGIIDLSTGIQSIANAQPVITTLPFKSKKEAITKFGEKLAIADQPAPGSSAGNLYLTRIR